MLVSGRVCTIWCFGVLLGLRDLRRITMISPTNSRLPQAPCWMKSFRSVFVASVLLKKSPPRWTQWHRHTSYKFYKGKKWGLNFASFRKGLSERLKIIGFHKISNANIYRMVIWLKGLCRNCLMFLETSTYRIHVWHIYLHLPSQSTKCR